MDKTKFGKYLSLTTFLKSASKIYILINILAFVFVVHQILLLNPVLFKWEQSLSKKDRDPGVYIFPKYQPIGPSPIPQPAIDATRIEVVVKLEGVEFVDSLKKTLIRAIEFPTFRRTMPEILLRNSSSIFVSSYSDIWKISLSSLEVDWVLPVSGRAWQMVQKDDQSIFLVVSRFGRFVLILDADGNLVGRSMYLPKGEGYRLDLAMDRLFLCNKDGYFELVNQPNSVIALSSLNSDRADEICGI